MYYRKFALNDDINSYEIFICKFCKKCKFDNYTCYQSLLFLNNKNILSGKADNTCVKIRYLHEMVFGGIIIATHHI